MDVLKHIWSYEHKYFFIREYFLKVKIREMTLERFQIGYVGTYSDGNTF